MMNNSRTTSRKIPPLDRGGTRVDQAAMCGFSSSARRSTTAVTTGVMAGHLVLEEPANEHRV
jgi:hypothetical protein